MIKLKSYEPIDGVEIIVKPKKPLRDYWGYSFIPARYDSSEKMFEGLEPFGNGCDDTPGWRIDEIEGWVYFNELLACIEQQIKFIGVI